MSRTLKPGDIVQHFKRQWVKDKSSSEYLYEILTFARHTETDEILVVYKALYGEMGIWARPYEMFMGKVDREKYPESEQEYRFEMRK